MLVICFISVNSLTDFEQLKPVKREASFVPKGFPTQGRFSSFFGIRWHPFTRRRQFHQGIDIAGPIAAPVRATAPGSVKWIGRRQGYGRCVIIDHGHGWETLYAHLQSSSLRQGEFIDAKQVIGKVGMSGWATGPHLHYEVKYLGQSQDPLHFINGFDRPMISRLENSDRRVSFRQD